MSITFSCNNCQSTLTRSKVLKHRCKNISTSANDLNLVDKSKISDDVKLETEIKSRVRKPSNLYSQKCWNELVTAIFANHETSDENLKIIIDILKDRINIPQKKDKFVNYINSIALSRRVPDCPQMLWDIISLYDLKARARINESLESTKPSQNKRKYEELDTDDSESEVKKVKIDDANENMNPNEDAIPVVNENQTLTKNEETINTKSENQKKNENSHEQKQETLNENKIQVENNNEPSCENQKKIEDSKEQKTGNICEAKKENCSENNKKNENSNEKKQETFNENKIQAEINNEPSCENQKKIEDSKEQKTENICETKKENCSENHTKNEDFNEQKTISSFENQKKNEKSETGPHHILDWRQSVVQKLENFHSQDDNLNILIKCLKNRKNIPQKLNKFVNYLNTIPQSRKVPNCCKIIWNIISNVPWSDDPNAVGRKNGSKESEETRIKSSNGDSDDEFHKLLKIDNGLSFLSSTKTELPVPDVTPLIEEIPRKKTRKPMKSQKEWHEAVMKCLSEYKTSDEALGAVINRLKTRKNFPQKFYKFNNFVDNISISKSVPNCAEILWRVISSIDAEPSEVQTHDGVKGIATESNNIEKIINKIAVVNQNNEDSNTSGES